MKQRPVEWVFHVGAHKTATTHVQDTLERVRDELRSAGICYLTLDEIRERRPLTLPDVASARLPLLRSIARRYAARTHWLRTLDTDCRTVLISEEKILGKMPGLFDAVTYPNLERNLADLQQLVQYQPARFFLSIRSFATILPSTYGQLARYGRAYPGMFDAIRERTLATPPRWKHLVDRMVRVVGEGKLRVWRYEDYADAHEPFLSALCGGAIQRFPLLPAPERTRSPSLPTILELEKIPEALRKPRDQRMAAGERICARDASTERFQPFSEAERRVLDGVYRDDVDGIDRQYPGLLITAAAPTCDALRPAV